MTIEKVLPCAHCGQEPRLYSPEPNDPYYFIRCDCGIETKRYKTKKWVMTIWNHRPPALPEMEVEAVSRVIAETLDIDHPKNTVVSVKIGPIAKAICRTFRIPKEISWPERIDLDTVPRGDYHMWDKYNQAIDACKKVVEEARKGDK